jgi:hypothetical protein
VPPSRTAQELDAPAGETAATLAEFRPATFPEALLATQMIGTQRMALPCLRWAAALGMITKRVGRGWIGASRLMALLTEQVAAMVVLRRIDAGR